MVVFCLATGTALDMALGFLVVLCAEAGARGCNMSALRGFGRNERDPGVALAVSGRPQGSPLRGGGGGGSSCGVCG